MATPRPSQRPRKSVVVFGASWAKEDSELYQESVTLGREIALDGYKLINGGYGGTMEGTAKGAAEVSGSQREGVIVSALFPYRQGGGNAYLTETTDTPSLLGRIAAMIDQADYFVIMKGTLGTLTEASIVWNVAALSEAAGMPVPVIIAYRDPWEGAFSALVEKLHIPPGHAARIQYVDSAAEAMKLINAHYKDACAAADAAAER